MIPPHEEPDNVFIKRLEEAGITNELLLSDQELSRGRVLLSKVLPDSEACWIRESQSTLSLTEYISRLTVAVASHKRLPPEFLEQIFLSLFEGGKNDETRIPPDIHFSYSPSDGGRSEIYEVPWTLGQVCRIWRQLSRSMPELWGKTNIELGQADYWDPQPKDIDIQMKIMTCAEEILPEVSRICLQVSVGERDIIPTRGLTPYLGYLSELHWWTRANTRRESMEIFLPGFLSKIQCLAVCLEEPTPDASCRAPSYADLFDKSSCPYGLDSFF
ncbi:hypothetical protein C0995_014571 [Termitomyces sp. Mi166|nr:hypothetical protein C0995_014571 [Termitomyces sp. Mi166\